MNPEESSSADTNNGSFDLSDLSRSFSDNNSGTNVVFSTTSVMTPHTHDTVYASSSGIQQLPSGSTDPVIKIEPQEFDNNEKLPTLTSMPSSSIRVIVNKVTGRPQIDVRDNMDKFKMPQTPDSHSRSWRRTTSYYPPSYLSSRVSKYKLDPSLIKYFRDRPSSVRLSRHWGTLPKIKNVISLSNRDQGLPSSSSSSSSSSGASTAVNCSSPAPEIGGYRTSSNVDSGRSQVASTSSGVLDLAVDIEGVDRQTKLNNTSSIIDMDIDCVLEGEAINISSNEAEPTRSNVEESVVNIAKSLLSTRPPPPAQDEVVVLDEEGGLSAETPALPTAEELVKDANKESDDLNKHLMPILECAVCLEYIIPPIYHCQRGHLICQDCKSQLPCCHTCRSPFLQTRNLAMEQVARQLKYPCKYHLTGCAEHHKLEDKFEHENNCMYRAYLCIQHGCEWKGFLPEILNHMSTAHEDMLLYGPKCRLSINLTPAGNISENWFLTAFNEIFRVNFMQNGARTQIFGGVQYYGPKKKSKNYTYTFEVKSENDNKRGFTYFRTTHNDSKKMSAYYANGDSFFIRPQAAYFFSTDNKMNVTLTISKNN